MADLKSLEVIKKKYGASIIGSGGPSLFSVIPTGSLVLDDALGVGGWPLGRIIEVYGPESSAKTTLCLTAVREAQKLGCRCAFIDVEHSLDLNWAELLGVDVTAPLFQPFYPDWAEQALDIVEDLLGDFTVIVLDSVAGLLPKSEAQGEVGDRNVGLVARLMSQTMRMVAGAIKNSNTLVIFTNQLRDTISAGPGPSSVTTGGNALKYYSSIRVQSYRSTYIGPDTEPIGNVLKVTVRKNKVAPPMRKVDLTIYYDEGISLSQELIDFGLNQGHIKRAGAWYSFPILNSEEPPKAQGGAAARQLLLNDKELRLRLENEMRQSLRLPIIEGE